MAREEELDTVLVRHPDIPGDPIRQARSAFENHLVHAGWVLADPEPSAAPDPPRPTQITTPEAPPERGASALPDTEDATDQPPKRRRATKEGE